MEGQTIQIPFSNFGKPGVIEVICKKNTSPVTSGFEIVKEIVHDLNICIGYPTMHAYVKEFSGYGFSRYCGWIQVVTMEFYSSANSGSPDDKYYEVDVTPVMKKNGLPFFAYGYPADIYDAPCNTYYIGAKLIWRADTFFAAMPSYLNSNSISFLAGFQWGFTEYNDKGSKRIDITPVQSVDSASWEKHMALFNRDFPKWSFVK